MRAVPLAAALLAPSLAVAQAPAPSAQTPPRDFTMPASGQVTVAAKDGLTFDVRINGQGPFHALFDTGSDNLMTASLARRLGIQLSGNSQPFGGGSAVISAQKTQIETLEVGDLTLSNQPFYVISPADAQDDEDPSIVLGYETLQRLIVTVDPARNQITFTDDAAFHPPARASRIPLTIAGFVLLADGSVNGIPGRFVLDTGNEFCFELDDAFVRPNHLVETTGAHYRGFAGSSYGGKYSDAWIARVDQVKLGDAEVRHIVTDLSTVNPTGGGISGNVGQSILLQFRSTWDVRHHALYLEKTPRWGRTEVFNRAGIITEPEAHGQRIETVFPGSPAAEAGLAARDLITAINGKAPGDDLVIPAFLRKPGTAVHLTVQHGNQTRTVTVRLREIL
ncbi:MAG TPA: aspartyl protease family protein [Acidobacteriaceae bacterium]|nr:aspartyl protease family protein [Acidobacteriaceae bacterium]